ncbi:MAG: hypothetical protein ACRC7S_14570 [Cetobacterium sp.]
MFTREMMLEIHEVARNLEGDYSARLALAFREVANKELATLQGSEKQVAWAAEIRANILKGIAKLVSDLQVCDIKPHLNEKRTEKALKVAELVANETSSKFFIENRGVVAYLESTELNAVKRVMNLTDLLK